MSKVICLGYFGRGNSGDEAFKLAHEWLFGAENIELRSSQLKPEDIKGRPVILGGGDVVAPFFLDWIPRGTPFSMVGVGLKYEEASIRALREHGDDLQHAWYRNRIDVDLTRAAGMKSDYVPDIVFSLRHHDEELPAHILDKVVHKGGKPTAIVCLTDHYNSRYEIQDPRLCAYLEYMKWEMAAALDHLSRYMHVVFFPLSVYANHQDARIHFEVARRMKNRSQVVEIREELTPGQAISVFRKAEHVFSMKLHGNIYGLLTERACVNIGTGRKHQKLFEEGGLKDLSLDPFSFTKDRFLAAVANSVTPNARQRVADLALSSYEELVKFRKTIQSYVGLEAGAPEGTLEIAGSDGGRRRR
ncbi:polysaccharide pyruvyl transferase family protein [Acetobacteraceae bacterium H6797]|nr:polysaccharide pyruvyl transferase family protein [Acetobacteraceae bacterium H6797]